MSSVVSPWNTIITNIADRFNVEQQGSILDGRVRNFCTLPQIAKKKGLSECVHKIIRFVAASVWEHVDDRTISFARKVHHALYAAGATPDLQHPIGGQPDRPSVLEGASREAYNHTCSLVHHDL